MGEKETLKCIPALNDRDEHPSCLFGASAKSAQDFFLDHSLPRMQSGLTANFGTVIIVKGTSGFASPGELTDC